MPVCPHRYWLGIYLCGLKNILKQLFTSWCNLNHLLSFRENENWNNCVPWTSHLSAWLHTHSPDCTTRKLVGHFMIAHLYSRLYDGNSSALYDLPTVRLGETRRALHDCTLVLRTVRLYNSLALYMISRLYNSEIRRTLYDPLPTLRTVRLGKLVGVLWSSTIQLGNSSGSCSTDRTTQKLVEALWLHNCSTDCRTRKLVSVLYDCTVFRTVRLGKLVGRFIIANLFSGLYG